MYRTASSLDVSKCPQPIREAIEFFRPKPSPWPLIRIGGSGDGAYLLPDCLDTISACFSPGVRNSKRFEDELLGRKGIRSHLMDFTSDPAQFSTPLEPGVQTFEKKWLSPFTSENAMSLEDWIARYEPNEKGNLLLQIDIEGGEWPIFSSATPETISRFRLIVVELHKLDDLMSDLDAFSSRAAKALSLLQENFTVIHAHPNNCCGTSQDLFDSGFKIPRTLELTMVRTEALEQALAEAPGILPSLPHPLDIGRNVRRLPPIFLGRGWRNNPNQIRTSLRIVSQFLEYELLWRWKTFIPPSLYRWFKKALKPHSSSPRRSS